MIRNLPSTGLSGKKIVRDHFADVGNMVAGIYVHLWWRDSTLRNLKKNSKKLWYSNYSGRVPIVDENGDETGDYIGGYASPVEFLATLSASRGNAYSDMFGTNLNYTRTLATVEKLPIKEESLIWVSEPVMKADGTVDEESADYTVAGIADGLNGIVVALKARAKNA